MTRAEAPSARAAVREHLGGLVDPCRPSLGLLHQSRQLGIGHRDAGGLEGCARFASAQRQIGETDLVQPPGGSQQRDRRARQLRERAAGEHQERSRRGYRGQRRDEGRGPAVEEVSVVEDDHGRFSDAAQAAVMRSTVGVPLRTGPAPSSRRALATPSRAAPAVRRPRPGRPTRSERGSRSAHWESSVVFP